MALVSNSLLRHIHVLSKSFTDRTTLIEIDFRFSKEPVFLTDRFRLVNDKALIVEFGILNLKSTIKILHET